MVLLRINKNHTICTPTASHLLAVEKAENYCTEILEKGGYLR